MAREIKVEVDAHDLLKIIRALVKKDKNNYKLTELDKILMKLLLLSKKAINKVKTEDES